MKLDMKKPFGTVSGEHAARFEQDGLLFDADGCELDPSILPVVEPVALAPASIKRRGKPGRKAAVEVAIKDAAAAASPPVSPAASMAISPIDAQLAAQGV